MAWLTLTYLGRSGTSVIANFLQLCARDLRHFIDKKPIKGCFKLNLRIYWWSWGYFMLDSLILPFSCRTSWVRSRNRPRSHSPAMSKKDLFLTLFRLLLLTLAKFPGERMKDKEILLMRLTWSQKLDKRSWWKGLEVTRNPLQEQLREGRDLPQLFDLIPYLFTNYSLTKDSISLTWFRVSEAKISFDSSQRQHLVCNACRQPWKLLPTSPSCPRNGTVRGSLRPLLL